MSLFEVEPGTDHDEQAPAVGAGTRLHRIEIFNWGTFHEKVWTLDLGGRNALLTGDIGSGKSTMVDAVTTLLVPAQRISYNKAAGAETRERDLRSYVLGFYKSERNEEAGGSRPVGLRGPEHFSVILGVFRDIERATTTTLAQVFRAREDTSQPERFFVVFDGGLSITEHFSNPGDSLADLRKQLKTLGANVSDGFNEYRRSFRRRLGITSDQALDLFLQTVSMKAVDNLNEFVRSHMLEPVDMSKRIDALVAHFDDLTKAHDAVVRARDQLELLVPLVGHLDAYDEHSEAAQRLGRLIETAPFYFATAHDSRLAPNAERPMMISVSILQPFPWLPSLGKACWNRPVGAKVPVAGLTLNPVTTQLRTVCACEKDIRTMCDSCKGKNAHSAQNLFRPRNESGS